MKQKKLTNPSVVIGILKKAGLRLTKGLGQHFLVDENIRRKIIEAAELDSSDVVLEVGPGIGTLSQEIAPKVKKLWLIELDETFIPILKENVPSDNTEIRNEDALQIDSASLDPAPTKMVSNLPYNIAAPLIIRLLSETTIERFVLMVQHEAAIRLSAGPHSKEYGALTVKIAYFAKIKKLFDVSNQVFLPKPNVRSAVIEITRRPGQKADARLFKLIRELFAHRRKSVKRGLILAGYNKEAAEKALQESGIDPKKRPENLVVVDFQALDASLAKV